MKRKRQWNFGDFSTSFGEFFILRMHTPLPTFRPTPSLAGKILRPPTLFNLSTYGAGSIPPEPQTVHNVWDWGGRAPKCVASIPNSPGSVRVLCRVRLLSNGGGEGHVGARGDEALHVGAVLKVRVQLLKPGGRLDVAEVGHGGVGGGDGGGPVRDAGGREKGKGEGVASWSRTRKQPGRTRT